MRVFIDKEKCAGHARCHAAASNLFAIDDSGYIVSVGFDVPKGQEALARRGARACPERVISVIEDHDRVTWIR